MSSNSLDIFNIQKLKGTKAGGQTWYMTNEDFTSDSQVYSSNSFGQSADKDDAGTAYTIAQSSKFTCYISTTAGLNDAKCATDQQLMTTRGYMQGTSDWKNIEFTAHFQVFQEVDDFIIIGVRGGTHKGNGTPSGCTGSAYQVEINTKHGGLVRVRKQNWNASIHNWLSGLASGFDATKPCGWVIKVIVYNNTGDTSVTVEVWLDADHNNNFVKVLSGTDTGQINSDAGECNCTNKGQPITWGGPAIMINGNSGQFGFKNMSCREISLTASSTGGGGSTGGGTSTGGTGGTTDTTPTFPTPASNAIVNNGGLLLSGARVYVIFWGTDWNTRTSPYSKTDVMNKINTLFSNTCYYFDNLIQYNIKRPILAGSAINTTYPLTSSITPATIDALIKDCISHSQVPDNPAGGLNLYYIMPPFGQSLTAGSVQPTLAANATNQMYNVEGDVLTFGNATIHYIFWGSVWNTRSSPFTKQNLIDSINAMHNSHYLEGMLQYRVNKPAYDIHVNTTFTPKNNWVASDLLALIKDSIAHGLAPDKPWPITIAAGSPTPEQHVYFIIGTPGNIPSSSFTGGDVAAFHGDSQDTATGKTNNMYVYAYMNVYPAAALSTEEFFLTHELVEVLSQPVINSGVSLAANSTLNDADGTELADVCSASGSPGTDGSINPGDSPNYVLINGVTCSKYWSDKDGSCKAYTAVPTWISCPSGSYDSNSELCTVPVTDIHNYEPQPYSAGQKEYIYAMSNYKDQIDTITFQFTRVLVNAISNPILNTGLYANNTGAFANNSSGNKELTTVCDSAGTATVNGVLVAKYWDNILGSCVAPTTAFSNVTCKDPNTWNNTTQSCSPPAVPPGPVTQPPPPPPPPPPTSQGTGYTATNITASSDDGNVPANVADGDLNTRWSANGIGQYIRLDFGSAININDVKIAWYKGDIRTNNFQIWTAAAQGASYVKQVDLVSTKGSLALQDYPFPGGVVSARYVKVVVNGNSVDNWASITEIQVWGPDVPTDTTGGGTTGGTDGGGTTTPPATEANYNFVDTIFSVDYSAIGLCNPVAG